MERSRASGITKLDNTATAMDLELEVTMMQTPSNLGELTGEQGFGTTTVGTREDSQGGGNRRASLLLLRLLDPRGRGDGRG
uniref:Uncharacterized protein n=1 Tax=Oryza rufipogon TaxID=4529 RepID=A0A0E0PLQ3_ORYRU